MLMDSKGEGTSNSMDKGQLEGLLAHEKRGCAQDVLGIGPHKPQHIPPARRQPGLWPPSQFLPRGSGLGFGGDNIDGKNSFDRWAKGYPEQSKMFSVSCILGQAAGFLHRAASLQRPLAWASWPAVDGWMQGPQCCSYLDVETL